MSAFWKCILSCFFCFVLLFLSLPHSVPEYNYKWPNILSNAYIHFITLVQSYLRYFRYLRVNCLYGFLFSFFFSFFLLCPLLLIIWVKWKYIDLSEQECQHIFRYTTVCVHTQTKSKQLNNRFYVLLCALIVLNILMIGLLMSSLYVAIDLVKIMFPLLHKDC